MSFAPRMTLLAGLIACWSCTSAPAPSEVVTTFVEAVVARDWERAYQHTSDRYRKGVSLVDFRAGVHVRPYLMEASGFRATSSATNEKGTASVEGLLLSGGDIPCSAILLRHKGGWRLDSFQATAEPLLPSPTESNAATGQAR